MTEKIGSIIGTPVLLFFLYCCAREDHRLKLLSVRRFWVFGGIGLIWFLICKPFSWMELAGGAGLGLVLLWVSHVSKEQFGAGDAWIFFISGMFLGAEENMRLLLWSLIICGIYSMGMLLLKRRSRKERIAFAPFVLGAEVLLLLRKCQFRRGSLTVEASLIFPVLVLLLMFFLHTTISGFMQVEKQAEQIQQQQELDTTAVFWKNIHQNNIKEIITSSKMPNIYLNLMNYRWYYEIKWSIYCPCRL